MNACIRRAREGDQSAKRKLVETLRPRIAKMAAYYGRICGEDPDDLLQEAWLGLLEALPEVDMKIGTPEQYLITRARWKLLDAVKRAKVRRCASLDDAGLEHLTPVGSDGAVASACVSEFVGELKTTQREVLYCLLAGLTWREAGEKLGCASANIAYHVRQIRRRYEEWSEEPACFV
ncbi:MAG: sigma-70 family RNA polymerase sigma factor [Armatimonadota bacterium]|nr:sigma-70 family RNA polymerase sigma factor [bacterium]